MTDLNVNTNSVIEVVFGNDYRNDLLHELYEKYDYKSKTYVNGVKSIDYIIELMKTNDIIFVEDLHEIFAYWANNFHDMNKILNYIRTNLLKYNCVLVCSWEGESYSSIVYTNKILCWCDQGFYSNGSVTEIVKSIYNVINHDNLVWKKE